MTQTPQNFVFQNQKSTSPFTFLGHCHLDHHATVCTIRNYDPLKQAFFFMPYKNPNRPLMKPQEYLIPNEDYLTPPICQHMYKNSHRISNKILSGPLTDNERSYYHTLVSFKKYIPIRN